MTDIEIAYSIRPKKIFEIAKKLGIKKSDLELYGDYKAKIKNLYYNSKAKLILVTAINPTSSGEGKTTVSIGLADAMNALGYNTCLSLREPSLGPVFGLKGGATGGGYSQILPMEDINLHFTGDFHAITSANNLLSSFIDNHIYHGNQLNIDPAKIVFNRCLDLNDRALRDIDITISSKKGIIRKENFNITAASEIMAILCLATNFEDLKVKLGNILVAYTFDKQPIYARDLKAVEPMAILLKDAIKPNLVQTLFGTPALVHGGPFANIAHGCSSILATKIAMTYSDYTITEAGFGADLGAEKFLDTKCRLANIIPDAVVVVTTTRALKLHGGATKDTICNKNLDALKKGLPNLVKHIKNLQDVFKVSVVCAINKFKNDDEEELEIIKQCVKNLSAEAEIISSWENGAEGGKNLAQKVVTLCKKTSKDDFKFCYNLEDTIKEKIEKIATKIYGAKGVNYLPKAMEDINLITSLGYQNLPIIIAKTQYSLSDNPKLLACPKDFSITIRELQLRSGAGFIVAIAGDILLMPGLPKHPAGENMRIDNGQISGLF